MKTPQAIVVIGGGIAGLLSFWTIALLSAICDQSDALPIVANVLKKPEMPWGEFAAALFGAFAGAYSAHRLQVRYESAKQDELDYQVIIKAQTILLLQNKRMEVFFTAYLDPYKNDPRRHIELAPLYGGYDRLRLEASELSFLLPDSPQDLLIQIQKAQHAFGVIDSTIENRSTAYDQFDNAMNSPLAVQKNKEAELIHYTNLLYEVCEKARKKNLAAFELLKTAGESRFRRKFLTIND